MPFGLIAATGNVALFVIALAVGITIIVVTTIRDNKQTEGFEQSSHVKVLTPPYDWAKDPDFDDAA